MTDKQILEELLYRSPIFMVISFIISFGLCLMLLPLRGSQKIYVSSVVSIVIPQIACIFPLYFYTFLLGDNYHELSGKIYWSFIAISFFVSPHWILLILLCIVIFVRNFRSEERSYLGDAVAALLIGGTLAALGAYTALTGAAVGPFAIG
jgi:hypothetical protein